MLHWPAIQHVLNSLKKSFKPWSLRMQISLPFKETKLSAKGPTKNTSKSLRSSSPGYENTWRSSQEPARKGYAGTMFSIKELTPVVDFPRDRSPSTMDLEGRIITLEFDKFFVTQVYTTQRWWWSQTFRRTSSMGCQICWIFGWIRQGKPVPCKPVTTMLPTRKSTLLTQPVNRRSPGFTDEEREGFTNLWPKDLQIPSAMSMVMSQNAYTWWAQRMRLQKSTIQGWRIDYWLTSNRIADKVT